STAVCPNPTAYFSDGNIIVNWDAVPGATNYSIQYRERNSNHDWTNIFVIRLPNTPLSTTAIIRGVKPGTEYEIIVQAMPFPVNQNGGCNRVYVTTPADCSGSLNVTLISLSGNTFAVSWN